MYISNMQFIKIRIELNKNNAYSYIHMSREKICESRKVVRGLGCGGGTGPPPSLQDWSSFTDDNKSSSYLTRIKSSYHVHVDFSPRRNCLVSSKSTKKFSAHA